MDNSIALATKKSLYINPFYAISCNSISPSTAICLPDEPFPNSRASRSGDRRISWSSGMSPSSKNVKSFVGYVSTGEQNKPSKQQRDKDKNIRINMYTLWGLGVYFSIPQSHCDSLPGGESNGTHLSKRWKDLKKNVKKKNPPPDRPFRKTLEILEIVEFRIAQERRRATYFKTSKLRKGRSGCQL